MSPQTWGIRGFIGERNKSSTEYCSFGGYCDLFFFFLGIAVLQKWVVLSDLAHGDCYIPVLRIVESGV